MAGKPILARDSCGRPTCGGRGSCVPEEAMLAKELTVPKESMADELIVAEEVVVQGFVARQLKLWGKASRPGNAS